MCDPVSASDPEYLLPYLKGGMSLRQIVEADNVKNYAGEEVTVDDAYQVIQRSVQSGSRLYRAGNTVFITDKLSPTAIEFHTVNGESGPQLIKNVISYMGQLAAKGVTSATTYYDNPKINALWEQAPLDVGITKVDQGQDRTFEAKVRL